MPTLPACCHPSTPALDDQFYAAYNRGGDPTTAGLNYQGHPCPEFSALPDNVRAKWAAVAECATACLSGPMITLPADTSFGAAIRWLKEGHKVSRAGWNGKGMWLALQVPNAKSLMGHPYPYMAVDGSFFPWTPNVLDALADDWGIVEFSFEAQYVP